MFINFKKSNLIALILILSFAMTSCGWQPLQSLKIGEDNAKKENLKLSLGPHSCFSDLKNKIDDYFSGKLTQRHIQLFMDCVRTSLDRFQFYSVGRSKDQFKPSELQSFLNREFLVDRKLSNEFMNELMKFKVILLGGGMDAITRAELKGIIEFLVFIEEEAILNLPLMRMIEKYSKDKKQVPGLLEMELAKIQFMTSAKKFAERLTRTQSSYDLNSFAKLVIEKRKFLKNEKDEQEKLNPEIYVKTLKSLKVILTGDTSETINADMWPQIFDLSARSYMLYLSYKLYLEKSPWTFGDGLKYFITSVNELFDFAHSIIEVQPNGVLTFDKIDQFIDALQENQFLPNYLRTESLKTTYKHLVSKVFSPHIISLSSPFSGVSQHTLNEIRSEFILWSEVQKNINQIAGTESNVNLNEMLNFDFFKIRLNEQKPHPELEKILKNIRPLYTGNDVRAHIVFKDEFDKYNVKHNVQGLTRLNLFRALSRLLFRGFSKDERQINLEGITEEETREFVDVIRSLAEDLKVLNPNDKTSGYRIFIEANLFTFSGNGIQTDIKTDSHLLNFKEVSELLALIWTGAKISSTIHEKLSENMLAESRLTPLSALDMNSPLDSYKSVSRDFFIKNFRSIALPEIPNLPYMVSYVKNLKTIEYTRFVTALLDIASDENDDQSQIQFSHTATIVTLLHYAEVLFVTFDKNKDGVLSEFEIMNTFPRFHYYMARGIEKNNGEAPTVERVKALFAFLAESKRLPESFKDKTRIFFLESWYFDDDPAQKYTSLPQMSLDRGDIINVLQLLTASH